MGYDRIEKKGTGGSASWRVGCGVGSSAEKDFLRPVKVLQESLYVELKVKAK